LAKIVILLSNSEATLFHRRVQQTVLSSEQWQVIGSLTCLSFLANLLIEEALTQTINKRHNLNALKFNLSATVLKTQLAPQGKLLCKIQHTFQN